MKFKKNDYVALSIFAVLLLAISWSAVAYTQTNTALSGDLYFRAKANQETFILGEPVFLQFEITNKGQGPVSVHAGGVETGFLKVFVARQDGEYEEYFGYGWGLIMGRMTSLQPGQSQRYKEVKVLYQGKIEVSHLNERAAREKLKGKISTEYAFPEPGIYLVKGVSYFGENGIQLESEPARIEIKAPVGDDLEIWNQIKGNPKIALLMQNDGFNTDNESEQQQLTKQVEQIIARYPDSIYASYLKPHLENFKAGDAKRKEAYKNMRSGQKPE